MRCPCATCSCKRQRSFAKWYTILSFIAALVSLVAMLSYQPTGKIVSGAVGWPFGMLGIALCLSFFSMLVACDRDPPPQLGLKTMYTIDVITYLFQSAAVLVTFIQGHFLCAGIVMGTMFVGFLIHTGMFLIKLKKQNAPIELYRG